MTMTNKLQEAAERILALRRCTRTTGFKTTRSQNDILGQFEGAELADLLRHLERLEENRPVAV